MTHNRFEVHQPRVYDVATYNQFVKQAAYFITGVALDSVAEEGSFRCAVSGGATPFGVYTALAKDPNFPFTESEIFQVDERFVSTESEESNQFHIKKALQSVLQDVKNFQPFTIAKTVDGSVKSYQTMLESLDEPMFDVVVLGIGEDGHIASLFPDSDEVKDVGETLVCSTIAPDQFVGSARLSLTLKAILSSKHIVVLLSGSRKGGVIKELIEGTKHISNFPAKWLLTHPQLTIFQCLNDDETEHE